MQMDICIDGLPVFTEQNEISLQCRQTIENLGMHTQMQIHIIKDQNSKRETWDIKRSHFIEHTVKINRQMEDYIEIKELLKQKHIPLYHCLNNGFSLSKEYGARCTCTIHHMLPFSNPTYCSPQYIAKFRKVVPRVVKQCPVIFTTSQVLKAEIIHYLHMPAERIVVVYPLIDPYYQPINFSLKHLYIKGKFQIQSPYLLFVGDIHPRREIKKIINVFYRLNQSYQELKLVILGHLTSSNTQYIKEIKLLIEKLAVERQVILISHYTEQDKLYFYNNALYFFELSEDTSINPYLLEAAACHCQILCSKTTLHKEILEDIGIYIDEEDIENLISHASFLFDKQAIVASYIEYSKKKLEKYRPSMVIQQMEQIYNQICSDEVM